MAEDLQVKPIMLAGRTFRAAQATTIRQDMFVMERLEEAGLQNLATHITDDLNLDELGRRTILYAYKSGQLFEILAAVIVEDGVRWSPEVARENAEFFENLSDPKSKKEIQAIMVGVILLFFVNGAAGLMTSPTPTANGNTPKDRLSGMMQSLYAEEGSSSTMETGMSSSGVVQDTT